MTSKSIEEAQEAGWSKAFWLSEIAYQLAVLNERNAEGDTEGVNRILRKVGLENLGSPIPKGEVTQERGGNLEISRAIAACIRSCVQTIVENQMETPTAISYMERYADAIDQYGSGNFVMANLPEPPPGARESDPPTEARIQNLNKAAQPQWSENGPIQGNPK